MSEAQLFVRIPESLKYLIDEDDRTNKDIVISAIERELNVSAEDSLSVIDRKIGRRESDLREKQEAARDHQQEAARIKDDLERLRQIREEKAEEDGDYEDRLNDLLDDMEAGECEYVPPYHPRVNELREVIDRDVEEIHFDLKLRAAKQDRDLYNTNFMEKRHADSTHRSDRVRVSDEWGDIE